MNVEPTRQAPAVERSPDRGPRFLVLALILLVLTGALLAGVIASSTARAATPQACEPVEQIDLAYEPPDIYTGTEVLISANVISGSLPLTYTWDLDDGSSLVTGTTTVDLFTVTHAYSDTGFYTITLTAWNSCTVEAPLTSTLAITVSERPCLTPTGLIVSYTPTQVYPYQETLFAGQVTTGTPPLTYTWDFGDETEPVSGTSAALTFSTTHAFTVPDVYTVSLAAWNLCTVTPTRESITVTVAPCGVISDLGITYWPTASQPGEPITFTAYVSGGTPAPDRFAWAFGDGVTGTGQIITHAYTATNEVLNYTVTLTAGNVCTQRATTTTLHLLPLPYLVYAPYVGKLLEPPESPEPPPAGPHLGYGSNVATADHAPYLADMGFDWAKGWANWPGAGARPPYNFADIDNQMGYFLASVPNVLLRIHGSSPPISEGELAAFRNYARALAEHVAGTWQAKGLEAIAYEIWNEPNLDYEWRGSPNAAHYTAALKAAYEGIKAGDPQAIVVSAGLATTGGGLNAGQAEIARAEAQARDLYGAIQVIHDLTFLRQMYQNGAQNYCDAIGTHPYGGSYPPDTPRENVGIPIYYRRAEEQHQIMIDNNDPAPMWNTEFGWVVETWCGLGEHEWMKVSEAQQAQYLADAYAYADEHWPWMGPMFYFNLAFATVPWYAECDPMRWYSITYRDGGGPIQFRQAFNSLKDMPKNSSW